MTAPGARPRRATARRGAAALGALALLTGCSSSSGAAGRVTMPPPSAPVVPAPPPAPAPAPEPTAAAPLPVQAHYARTPDGVALPDRAVSPGAVDPAATRAAVCGAGYRRQVPPPPFQDKQAVYSAYAVRDRAAVRIDHLVPVSLGGTSAVANLWPQPLAGGHGDQKDQLERRLHELVCAGRLPLAAAQSAMAGDWWDALRAYLPAAARP